MSRVPVISRTAAYDLAQASSVLSDKMRSTAFLLLIYMAMLSVANVF